MSQEIKIQNPCLYSFFSEYKLAKNVNKSQDGCWMWLWKVDFAWSERFWQSAGISSWHQQNFTGLWKYESKFPNSKSLLKIQMMTKVLLLWLDTGFLKKSDSLFTYQISFSTRASAWQFFALLPPQRRVSQ